MVLQIQNELTKMTSQMKIVVVALRAVVEARNDEALASILVFLFSKWYPLSTKRQHTWQTKTL